MDLVKIYQCLCDRILYGLMQGPLCVCHFQEILCEPQVKVSKRLAYLCSRGLVETEREGNWIVYSLLKKRTPELEANLRCLSGCAEAVLGFSKDLQHLAALKAICCEPAAVFGGATKRKQK